LRLKGKTVEEMVPKEERGVMKTEERHFGEFGKVICLPIDRVNLQHEEDIHAQFLNGVLVIRVLLN
jgi:hypothetical protein